MDASRRERCLPGAGARGCACVFRRPRRARGAVRMARTRGLSRAPSASVQRPGVGCRSGAGDDDSSCQGPAVRSRVRAGARAGDTRRGAAPAALDRPAGGGGRERAAHRANAGGWGERGGRSQPVSEGPHPTARPERTRPADVRGRDARAAHAVAVRRAGGARRRHTADRPQDACWRSSGPRSRSASKSFKARPPPLRRRRQRLPPYAAARRTGGPRTCPPLCHSHACRPPTSPASPRSSAGWARRSGTSGRSCTAGWRA